MPLTKKGVEEAVEAGRKICNIPVDLIYTSALIRAQMTAMLAMTQHRRKKVWALICLQVLSIKVAFSLVAEIEYLCSLVIQ